MKEVLSHYPKEAFSLTRPSPVPTLRGGDIFMPEPGSGDILRGTTATLERPTITPRSSTGEISNVRETVNGLNEEERRELWKRFYKRKGDDPKNWDRDANQTFNELIKSGKVPEMRGGAPDIDTSRYLMLDA